MESVFRPWSISYVYEQGHILVAILSVIWNIVIGESIGWHECGPVSRPIRWSQKSSPFAERERRQAAGKLASRVKSHMSTTFPVPLHPVVYKHPIERIAGVTFDD